jgi:hypothetical protein
LLGGPPLIVLSLIFIAWKKNVFNKNNRSSITRYEIFVDFISGYLAIVLCAIYLYFVYLDTANYANYIFSKFHIYVSAILNLIVFFAGITFINFFSKMWLHQYKFQMPKYKSHNLFIAHFLDKVSFILLKIKHFLLINTKILIDGLQSAGEIFLRFSTRIKILLIVVVSLTLYSGTLDLSKSYNDGVNSLFFIELFSNYTYDDKMNIRYPIFYYYMKFLQKDIPTNATVGIPPMVGPWMITGNGAMARYFLYPRNLVSLDLNDSQGFENVDYIIIDKGTWAIKDESLHGWPKILIKAKEVVYFDPSTRRETQTCCVFDPSLENNKNAFGFIKMR